MRLLILLAAAGIVTLSHIGPIPFLIDAFFRDTVIWRMPHDGSTKTFYLTFDDGPNPTATPALLDVLREKDVRATFFVIDKYVDESTAPILRRAFSEGHTVALHSGDRWLMLRSPDAIAAELHRAAGRIEALTDRKPCAIFRPHGGWRSVRMLRGIRRAGFQMAGWSWMSWDWVKFRKRTGPRVAAQIGGHAAPGKIAVIHDGHHKDPRADRRYAAEAAALIIDRLRGEGYEFRRLCEPPE